MTFGNDCLKICPFKAKMNTGLASGSVSATVVTQEALKAFRATEKYEKDSILLFIIINQLFATYLTSKAQETM